MPNLKMLKPKHRWLSALEFTSSGPQKCEIRPDNKNLKEENDDLEDHLDEAPRPHAGEGVDPHPQEQDPLTLERLLREIKSVDQSNSHSERIEKLSILLQSQEKKNDVTKFEHKSQETEAEKFDTGSAELSAMMASTDAADSSQDLETIEQSNDRWLVDD